MATPKAKQIIDLDKLFAADIAAARIAKTVKLVFLGEEFNVYENIQSFSMLRLGAMDDPASDVVSMIRGVVVPEDQSRWLAAWNSLPGLTSEQLMGIIMGLVEALGKDHTKSSSVSATGRLTPTS